ncbi:ATP-binding protein [Zavarzinia sp. CC-PAN008]|uniref:ATP-binding protein n=1 Tax=Zavarzinia sp. CC-PAN008 TaxID=3243332 RepID=UPI003F746AE2
MILAPHGRDAAVAHRLLEGAGIRAGICPSLAEFESRLDDDLTFAVVAEEALRGADLRGIAQRLAAQPAWSDVPIIVLTRRVPPTERAPDAMAIYEVAGNVTLLERPFQAKTFVSLAGMALKGRQRQFEARNRMEELHEGEARLRTALVAGHLGTWELDLTSRVLTASPECRALLNRAGEAPLACADILACVHREDRARLAQAVQEAWDRTRDCAVEFRTLAPGGGIRWVEIRARLVRDRAGRHPRLIGVSSDITDRKVSQEALTRLNEMLEERVAQRTAELTRAHAAVLAEIEQRERAEEQLRQAQKTEMIGQLTGGVAHDFNNLLTAVLGNLDLLRRRVPNDPRTAHLIEGALQGALRGAALTQRLLAFARRQDLTLAPRDMADLIRGASGLIEQSAGADVDLRWDLPDDLPPVMMDANQVELAVLNLVVNARDAMPNGGVLTISAERVEVGPGPDLAPGSYVRLVVSDTGEGMDSETLRKATEPFFSTKELGKGTGLGLSMVHGLAVQLNGALRLTSVVGSGTRAELWLPVTDVAAADEDPTPLAEQAAAPRCVTVLVVDDDALVAMSTVDMLAELGHTVVEANSGDEALAVLRHQQAIDLMVTDYSMPGMNGAQLARAARVLRPDLPILLATGYADLPAGTDINLPRIAKPYQQHELAAEIARVLQLADARGAVPAHAGDT